MLLRRGFVLEYFTLAWNVVGIVVLAITAYAARSVALAGFGLDSLIEIRASTVVIWELSGTGPSAAGAAVDRRGIRAARGLPDGAVDDCAGHRLSPWSQPGRQVSRFLGTILDLNVEPSEVPVDPG